MKRLFSLLLCLVLALSLIPSAAAGDIEIIEIEPEDEIILLASSGEGTNDARPTVTVQPESVTAYVGTTATFTVSADGADSYQWYYRTSSTGNWAKSTVTGAKTATLRIAAETKRNGYQYRCRLSNGAGYVYSDAATLSVTAKPLITTQPTSAKAAVGTTVSFTLSATGADSYQWYYRTSETGKWARSTTDSAKTATLKIEAAAKCNGYQYRCRVTNTKGSVYSEAATLYVKPVISTQPLDYTAGVGAKITLKVAASGAETYQWYYRTSEGGSWHKCTTGGATGASLSVTAAEKRNGYQYRCKVSNQAGSVYSRPATLDVYTSQCGDNLTWKLSGSGLLTIGGSGNWNDWAASPWSVWEDKYRSEMRLRIRRVTIEEGVTSIGGIAFYYCPNMEKVSIPASVADIGYAAFQYCDSLTTISVASGNRQYCSVNGVLFNKAKTSLIQFPGGKGGDYVIPDSVRTIEMAAFSQNRRLTSVSIPASVTDMGDYAFAECTSLEKITVAAANPILSSSGGLLLSKDKTVLIQVPGGKTGTCAIPSTVTTVGENAFEGCGKLTAITIPGSVTSLERGAFYGCSSLTSLTIPGSITEIPMEAFYNCSALKTAVIPDSVTAIGRDAFTNCASMETFTIPSGVTVIERATFWGCSSLKSIRIHKNVTEIESAAFYCCDALTDVYYGGTKTAWSKVRIDNSDEYNASLLAAAVHYNA